MISGDSLWRVKCRIVPNTFFRLGSLLFLAVGSVAAQVVVIPSTPQYNIQVLPGSTRQINVNITGGTLNTVNWSVLSTTGGASATFTTPSAANVSAISAGLPTVQVNIGPGTGTCSIPQPASETGTYAVTSTATVTVEAQSVDDPTKTGTFLFNVCAKTTTVMVAPAYQQAFRGQHRTLQSWVSGDTDETGTWSIVSQPSGGDGVLADTTNRDTDFVATETGRYTLQYTSQSNPAKSATAIVYVSPNSLPAYASTPNKTEPRECYVDPALTGGDYEVGAGKQYPSISSTPTAGTLAPGSIIRVWNTDVTGSNPSTYHEFYQIAASGTPYQPIMLCGVPDSEGNLPVIDGSNATGQPSIYLNGIVTGLGIISLYPTENGQNLPYGYWQNGSAGPSYVTVTGLHLVHGTPSYNYTPPGGGTPAAYNNFTSCLNIRSGSYVDLGGNHMDTCGLGVFTNDDGSNGWVTITQLVTITGNHVQNAGISGQDGEHGAYLQSFYALVQGNLFDNYNQLAGGSDIKWRGLEGIFRYNNLGSGAARLFDLVEEQDSPFYLTFEGYLGLPGDTNCKDSMYCLGDTAGPNIVAGYQESFQKDFIYGNVLFGESAENQVHYLADGTSGMNVRNGTLYFFSNTLDAARDIFDTGSNDDAWYGYFPGRIDARNNIFWASVAPYNGAAIQMAFGTESTIILNATTNLMKAGTFTIQPPIEGAPWVDNTQEGWSSTCDGFCQWPLSVPLDPHLYGLTNANYLTTATQPYDPTTLIPPSGSAAINAGKVLSGILQTMPVRRQYSIGTNSLIPRLNPLTIGAVDFAAEATASLTSLLNFPSTVQHTTSAAMAATLSNTGTGSLTNIVPTILGNNPDDFAISTGANACGATLAAGASCSIYVTFTPSLVTAFSASLSVADSATGSPQTATLLGEGSSPPNSVSLTPLLNFPSTVEHVTSAAMAATLTNTGSNTVTGIVASIGGNNPDDFAFSTGANACGATLAAGASCSIYVTFTPSLVTAFSASLSVADSATGSPQTATLLGEGTLPLNSVSLTPLLNFPSTVEHTTSAAMAATLTNTGSATVTGIVAGIGGNNPDDFALSTGANACGATLAAGASCSIYVTFTPSLPTAFSASLSVADSATGSPQTATLLGEGAAPASAVSLTPLLNFPSTVEHTTSAALAATLTNNSGATVTGIVAGIGGNNPDDFAISTGANACGATLAVGASCSIYVTFTPSGATAFSASLSVADSAAGSPQTAVLLGEGSLPPNSVSLTSLLNFPATTAHTTSAALAATLTNTGSNAVTGIVASIGGNNPDDFAISTGANACGATLAAGASCSIYVTFTPSMATAFSASLSVADSATGSPQVATLLGEGNN